jgi:hypothetical protein
MLTSLFKKQHERNARLPDGELERRRREEQRVRERGRKQAECRAYQEEDLKHKHLHGGAFRYRKGLAQVTENVYPLVKKALSEIGGTHVPNWHEHGCEFYVQRFAQRDPGPFPG